MRPNFLPGWVFLLAAAALGASLSGCGSNSNPASPASSASSEPTYRFGYYFGPGSMNQPLGVAISGDLAWVSNYGNNSLQTWSATQNLLGSITSYGSPITNISNPYQIAVGPDSYIYMMDADNGQVAVFSPTGIFETTFAKAQLGGDTGDGVAVNGTYAYVTDNAAHIGYRYTIGGSGPSKTFTASATFGNSGAGTLISAFNLVLDPSGNVYVADQASQRIMKYDANGVFQSAITLSSTPSDGPVGLALDTQGNLYASMALEPDVKMFSPSGALLETIGNGDMTAPVGLAFDPLGNLYVTDSAAGANKVVVFLKN